MSNATVDLRVGLKGRLARFGKESGGVSAVEFALLFPMMITLCLGSVEASQAVAADRKVVLTAHALVDVSSQYTDITDADISNILAAGSAIIAPYAPANLAEVVSELAINAEGQASVVWSDTLNGVARAVGQTVTIPKSLAVPNTYLILAEVQYNYNPTYGYVLTGTLPLQNQSYALPRQSNSIARTAS
jgi:Flp pilus assembly protein TadG